MATNPMNAFAITMITIITRKVYDRPMDFYFTSFFFVFAVVLKITCCGLHSATNKKVVVNNMRGRQVEDGTTMYHCRAAAREREGRKLAPDSIYYYDGPLDTYSDLHHFN